MTIGLLALASLVCYSLVGLAISLITLTRYAREKGGLDALTVLATIREIVGEALSFIWFLLIFHSWGLLNLKEAFNWSASLPPPVTTTEGQLLVLLFATLAAVYAVLYASGRLWAAFLFALAAAALTQFCFNFLDFAFLTLLLFIGAVAALGTAWSIISELRS